MRIRGWQDMQKQTKALFMLISVSSDIDVLASWLIFMVRDCLLRLARKYVNGDGNVSVHTAYTIER